MPGGQAQRTGLGAGSRARGQPDAKAPVGSWSEGAVGDSRPGQGWTMVARRWSSSTSGGSTPGGAQCLLPTGRKPTSVLAISGSSSMDHRRQRPTPARSRRPPRRFPPPPPAAVRPLRRPSISPRSACHYHRGSSRHPGYAEKLPDPEVMVDALDHHDTDLATVDEAEQLLRAHTGSSSGLRSS